MSIITSFPGYEFKEVEGFSGKQNMYRGTNVGRGGYVHFEEGVYTNVALLDISAQHPSSIIALNKFGDYTARYKELVDARAAIKHHDYDTARGMLGGILAKYLTNEDDADQLSNALKLVQNSTYGYCSATFENPFLDSRDKNNTVALRGALFMRTLQDEIIERGFRGVHFKTDSVKIPNATPEIIQFVMNFGKQYGYTFEHECTYDRMCLVNGSTYIAKYATVEQCYDLYGKEYVESSRDVCKKNKKSPGKWTATAAQFQVPYVFKTLFSKEPIEFEDLCETKEVKTALYLDMNEGLKNVEKLEQELFVLRKGDREHERQAELEKIIAENHDYHFVGKVGLFCPIMDGCGGGELVRESKDALGNTKYTSATGAKGYRWLEAEVVETLGKKDDINRDYYNKLVNDAIDNISQYGDFHWFVSDDPYIPDGPPWFSSEPPWEEESTPFDVR